MILYRWPCIDKWYIEGTQGVVADFSQALDEGYRWRRRNDAEPAAVPEEVPESRPDYQVEWLDDRFPERLHVGETIVVSLRLRNAGSLTWSWGGGNPFRIGYRYYRNRRLLEMSPEEDVRTDVPGDIAPGETTTVQVHVVLPGEPGNYTLEFDLVHEGVTWFKEKGARVLTRWLTVEAPKRETDAAVPGDGGGLPVPLFKDISAELPRQRW